MSDVSKEVIKAYRWHIFNPGPPVVTQIVDALRDERAKRLELDWNHHSYRKNKKYFYEAGERVINPHYQWEFSDWQALAHKQLMGEE